MPQPDGTAPRLRRRDSRRMAQLLALLVLLAVLVLLGMVAGTRPVPLSTTLDALLQFDPGNSDHLLVRHLRIPRTLLAAVVGAALGVAGTVMQALTRNPLSDPGILGVNAGAAVAIAAAITLIGVTDVAAYMAFGLLGAALAGGAVYLLGNVGDRGSQVRVVLAGAAVSIVLMSLTQIVLVNSTDQVFNQFLNWSVGSLQGRGYAVFYPVVALAGLGLLLAFSLAGALDMAALGSDLTKALGGNPLYIWSLAALSVVMLSGAATAAAGPVGFVGLTAPHIARLLAGPDHRWLLPHSMLVAAILVTAADVFGRVVAPPGEVGVGIMVALMGGPFFVLLVRRRRISQL